MPSDIPGFTRTTTPWRVVRTEEGSVAIVRSFRRRTDAEQFLRVAAPNCKGALTIRYEVLDA